MKYSGIGGQAVIEGIMMQNGDDYAIAVRKPDGEIEIKKDRYVSLTERYPVLGLPFIRGVFKFADSMVVGMKALTWSCSFFEDDEDAEPGKFEAWLDRVFGEKLESILMTVVMIFSFIMAIGIFMLLPLLIARLCRPFIPSETLMAVLEGFIRIAIFIIYIKMVSRMEDIRRTFMYHGSEHKCINCIEHGLALNVANVRASSKEHKTLRHQLYHDCYDNQYFIFHGHPHRYGVAAVFKPDCADPGDRRRVLRVSAVCGKK